MKTKHYLHNLYSVQMNQPTNMSVTQRTASPAVFKGLCATLRFAIKEIS